MNPRKTSFGSITAFIARHPLFALASFVLSIALSVYLYYRPLDYPEITYLVHPTRTAIFREGKVSRLSVQFDGVPVERDVSAVQVAIWNAGRRAVHDLAVLTPLTIQVGPDARLLEASVVKSSREICGLSVEIIDRESGKCRVNWRIFEEGDGCILQLVYSGDVDAAILARAVVEGQKELVAQRISSANAAALSGSSPQRWFLFGFLGWVLSLPLVGLWLMSRPGPLGRMLGIRPRFGLVQVACLILMAAGALAFAWKIWSDLDAGPPFGF